LGAAAGPPGARLAAAERGAGGVLLAQPGQSRRAARLVMEPAAPAAPGARAGRAGGTAAIGPAGRPSLVRAGGGGRLMGVQAACDVRLLCAPVHISSWRRMKSRLILATCSRSRSMTTQCAEASIQWISTSSELTLPAIVS